MMNNVPFSDDELREAAKKVQNALLESLPQPSECQHEFSPEFEAKMKNICTKARWKRSLRRAAQRAAMVFLTVCVGAGTWLAVDMDARAAFFGWVKERYENYIVYRFPEESITGGSTVPSNGQYQLAEVPEGYSLCHLDVGANDNSIIYENEAGDYLSILYSFDTEVSALYVFTNENGTFYQTTVNGNPADFIQSNSPDESNTILWVDENNTSFAIAGFFTEDELIEMAEGIHWVEEERVAARYRLGWIPEGLTEKRHKNVGNSMQVAYVDEQGRLLKFYCIYGEPSSAFSFYMEDPIYESVDVNGYAAEVMLSPSGEEGNTIYWTTEKNELFYISGFYPLEDLVKMAERVELVTGDIE